ncbi:FHA domain-containing protein [Undibacterium sp. Jales W-56]|uniref:FHA domain-containing protein n=1 Tax=Undibacterium sp. Jales W-56 TaxID=2897325 RepID=UPI0021D2D97A|nr:FHA domain-containing protein [Undibacterium sp. Jales W-56]MCU6432435.1 FHA domain-containing protein [Undibacterium sp. Jales W-56]
MSAPYFIEVLARNGDVIQRHQVTALPIRIGRAYDNEVILDDAHIAAHHLIIELDSDGHLIARDTGSLNGIIYAGKRQSTLALHGNTVIRIGHTSMRLRDAGFAVAAEVPDRTSHTWEGFIPGMIGAFLIALFAIYSTWQTDTKPLQAVSYVQAIAYTLGGGLIWSGLWAIANRLFAQHPRFGRHLFIFGAGIATLTLLELGSGVIAYAFSLDWLSRYIVHLYVIASCTMLFFHLLTIKPHHPKRFAGVSVFLMLLSSSLILMSNEQKLGRLTSEAFMSVLLPPAIRISPDHSTDEFMQNVSAMKARLDIERTKKVKDDGSDSEDD